MIGWPAEAVAALCGLVLGSFAVTAGIRFARGEAFGAGRSKCDVCGASLSFAHTIPVASFAALRGACTRCGARIDPLHTIGEVAGAFVLAAAVSLHDPVRGVLAAVLGLSLIASAAVDIKVKRLPDLLTLVIAVAGAALALRRSPAELLLGVCIGIGVVAILQLLRVLRARSGRDPGLGLGDLKLLGAVSLWLGDTTPWVLAAAAAGLLVLVVVRPTDRRLAFGPAIAVASWVAGMTLEWGLWPQAI